MAGDGRRPQRPLGRGSCFPVERVGARPRCEYWRVRPVFSAIGR